MPYTAKAGLKATASSDVYYIPLDMMRRCKISHGGNKGGMDGDLTTAP